jgi:hypothetical protein
VPVATASFYDRIMILPTTTTPAATTAAAGTGPGARGMPSRPMPNAPPPPAAAAASEDAPVEEAAEEDADATTADEPPMQAPVASPYPGMVQRPPETNFDYANPQATIRRRDMSGQTPTPTPVTRTPGVATPGTVGGTPPTTFPGTVVPQQTPQLTPQATPGTSSGTSRPGEFAPAPQQPQVTNPYGLPAGVNPGSTVGPAAMPDRAKYANPYQPQQQPKDPQ